LFAQLISSTALADAFPPGANTKESICNGRTARFSPKSTVKITYPNTKGMPIDVAAEKKAERIDTVRLLLKRGYYSGYFFDASSQEIAVYKEAVGEIRIDPTILKLSNEYTFRLPIDTLETVFKAKNALFQQHYGYDHDTLTWKASKAMEDSSWIWENYLQRMTTITETAKPNGEVAFEVQLDMNLFCQTAIANSALVSN
jgi:hypothetical protein